MSHRSVPERVRNPLRRKGRRPRVCERRGAPWEGALRPLDVVRDAADKVVAHRAEVALVARRARGTRGADALAAGRGAQLAVSVGSRRGSPPADVRVVGRSVVGGAVAGRRLHRQQRGRRRGRKARA
eukprot:1741832-Prymnesium_polylepis.1